MRRMRSFGIFWIYVVVLSPFGTISRISALVWPNNPKSEQSPYRVDLIYILFVLNTTFFHLRLFKIINIVDVEVR